MDNFGLITLMTFGLITFLLIAGGFWVAVSMGLVGVMLLYFFVGRGLGPVGMIMFNTANIFTYTPMPLFIFMGTLLLRSGLMDRIYGGATHLVGFLPGGLLHTNIMAMAIFGAVSGSTLGAVATMGTIAVPEMGKRGYDRKLLFGSITAGGGLVSLIPPSLTLIIYGAFVEESIPRLFMAGVFPGLLLAGLFMLFIVVTCVMKPQLVPERARFSLKNMASGMLGLWPIVVLISLVLGTIYLGIATVTESAAIGASVAAIFCAIYRKLTWQTVKDAGLDAAKATCWIMLVIIGAKIVAAGLAMLEVPAQLASWMVSLELGRIGTLAAIAVFYLVLGMFIDAVPMMLLTLPVTYPLVISLGFNGIWFGVLMVMFSDMCTLTPPVGMSLYVIDGVSGKKYLRDIILGAAPFVILDILAVAILVAFPNIALWLPSTMPKW